MVIYKYIIPFYYTFVYNRRGLDGIAYLLEFTLLPFIVWWLAPGSFTPWELAVTITTVTAVYEVGYLYNNVIAIRRDRVPTLRHSSEEITFLETVLLRVVFFRLLFTGVMVLLVAICKPMYAVQLFILLLAMTFVFYLYNHVRTGWRNRVLFFLLRFVRYYAVLFFSGSGAILASAGIAAVSLVNHLAWYRSRTAFGLGRFFGTKLFDAMVYVTASGVLTVMDEQGWARVFAYLFVVKILLFLVAYYLKGPRKKA